MYSIYHFFAHLVRNRRQFLEPGRLSEFPFDDAMLSCKNAGIFPDMAIRINTTSDNLTGGELIELKDSLSYNIASFNSTIPTGKKEITKLIPSTNSTIFRQMTAAGDDVFTLPIRDVFYLIRGRYGAYTKVCLVHGSFFETIPVDELIQQSFSQVLDEGVQKYNIAITDEERTRFLAAFSEQESFSKTRSVEQAAVTLRFRILSEVKRQANLLNPNV